MTLQSFWILTLILWPSVSHGYHLYFSTLVCEIYIKCEHAAICHVKKNILIPQLTILRRAKNPTLLKETLPWLSLFNTLRPVSKQPFMKNQVLKQVVHVKQYFLLEFHSDFRENYFTHPVLNHFDNIRNMVAVKHWKNKRVWSMHNMELFKLNNTKWGKCHIKFPIWYLYLKSWEWNLALFIASVCLKTQFLVRQGCDYCCQWYTSKIFQLNILPNYINTNWTVFWQRY